MLFYGCGEKQNVNPATDNQQVEKSGNYAYVFVNNSESPSWEKIPLREIQRNSGSGTQNNGGTHGSAEVDFVNGPLRETFFLSTQKPLSR